MKKNKNLFLFCLCHKVRKIYVQRIKFFNTVNIFLNSKTVPVAGRRNYFTVFNNFLSHVIHVTFFFCQFIAGLHVFFCLLIISKTVQHYGKFIVCKDDLMVHLAFYVIEFFYTVLKQFFCIHKFIVYNVKHRFYKIHKRNIFF